MLPLLILAEFYQHLQHLITGTVTLTSSWCLMVFQVHLCSVFSRQ